MICGTAIWRRISNVQVWRTDHTDVGRILQQAVTESEELPAAEMWDAGVNRELAQLTEHANPPRVVTTRHIHNHSNDFKIRTRDANVNVDTVKVAVFDPQEVWGAVADQGRHLGLLFSLHQEGHEVVNFIHIHVPHVVATDQHLQASR